MAKPPVAAKPNVPATTQQNSALPSYLQDFKGGSGLQGLDSNDFIIPRIKLLQAISEEVENFEEAKAGNFWLNVLDVPLGSELDFGVCGNKKRYLLLPPMGDTRGILARADDAVHWSPPNGEWQVKLKGVKNAVTWKTAPTVRESGLAEFGSSNPDDPESTPAATLFYEFLVYLPQHPELSPALMSLARSQAKKAKDLNGKIEFRRAPMQSQAFRANVIKDSSPEGDFFNYQFVANGFVDEETFNGCKAITNKFQNYKGADEEGVAREGAPTGEAAGNGEY